MPFRKVLMDLCRMVPGARGAVFVDHEGECIQQAVLDATLSAYDLSVAGAHAAPIMDNPLQGEEVVARGHDGVLVIRVVDGRYLVVLVGTWRVHARSALAQCREAAELLRALM